MKVDKINFNTKPLKQNLATSPIASKNTPLTQTIDIDYKKSSQAIRSNFMPTFKGQLIIESRSMYNSPDFVYYADAGEDVDPKVIESIEKQARPSSPCYIRYDEEPCLGLNDIQRKYKEKECRNYPGLYFKFTKDAIAESEYLDRLEHFANKRLGDAQYFLNENKEKLDRSLQSVEELKTALELKPWEKERQQDLEIAQYFAAENQAKYDKSKEKNDKYQSQIDYAQSQRPLAAKRYNVLNELDEKRSDKTFVDHQIEAKDREINWATNKITDYNKEIEKKEQAIKLHEEELKDTDVEIYHKRVLRVSKQQIEDAKNKIIEEQNNILEFEKENDNIKQNILPIKEKAVDDAYQKVENFYKEYYPIHCR